MLRKRTTVGDGESLLRVNVLHFGEITGLTGCRREVVVVAGRRCRIGGRGCKIQSKAQASCVGLAVSGPSVDTLQSDPFEHNTHVAPIMVMGDIAKTDFR